MAPQTILISALNRDAGKAKLLVRATRVWEATHTKKLLNTKVVFIDEEENQIMLTIWNNQKADYFPLLKEGSVYNISDFKIVSNPKEYRVVDAELALNFYHNTRVLPIEDTGRIPRFKFNITKFEDV
ncbi:uncharacterized protein LOC141665553 [Apium graveolens]|uniref:uncharacterized protein LOC141665553 n=1 Tax=Apium graveolens TaxID=4045 RepID=UPI003D7B2517